MTHNLFLAWSWFGHGELTEMALAFGISQFVNLRKMLVLKCLKKFEVVQSRIESGTWGRAGFPPTEKEVDKFLDDQEQRAPTGDEQSLVRSFSALPNWVQEEDIHRGNIPKVGEWMQKDSQVRHYMRSYQKTTPLEAHQKSKEYIWDHLFWAWSGMRKGVYHQHKWYDKIHDSSIGDFDNGVKHLAKALHTIEDSYAPGHTKRTSGTGINTDIYYWPDTKHRNATGAFILCVLSNLDQDQNAYIKDCGDKLNIYLNAQL